MEPNSSEGYKITITYQSKTMPFKVIDPTQNLKLTLDNIRKLSKNYPDKYWNLPEIDNGGNRIRYLLGRINPSSGKQEVFFEKNSGGDLLCLSDYGVKEGDQLILIKKVIAG